MPFTGSRKIPFPRRKRSAHFSEIVGEVRVGELGRKIGDWPADVSRNKAKHHARGRRETLYAQLSIKKKSGNLGTGV